MSSAEEQRQRVTVVSPFGQHQVDLPADVPVSGFLPDLLAMAGLHPSQTRPGGAGWQLEDAEGRVLPAEDTLAASGIAPGAVIQLRSTHPPVSGLAAVGLAQEPSPEPVYPDPGYPAGPQDPGYPAAGQAYPRAGQDLPAGGPQQSAPAPAPGNGYPDQGYPERGYPDQGYPERGYPDQGYTPQGYPGQGYAGQGYPAGAPDHRPADHLQFDQGQPDLPRPGGQDQPTSADHAFAGNGQQPGYPATRPERAQPPGPGQPAGGDQPYPAQGQGYPSGVPMSRHLPRRPGPSGPPEDSLTPLQRVHAVLPRRVSLPSRLAAATVAFFQSAPPPPYRPVTPDELARSAQPAGPGDPGNPPAPGPADPQAPGAPAPGPVAGPGAEAADLAQPTAAPAPRGHQLTRPSGKHRLLPSDLTVQSAPSRSEMARTRWRETDYLGRLDALITAPRLRHCATIAVVSPKGGVGKTTTTALLGTLFSLLRRDPTVAVDTNPDYGSLGRVLTPDQTWYVDDLARLVTEDDELSLTALESQLGRAIHGLLVVPAPIEPTRMSELDESSYHRVISKLKDFFSLILLDCGTGLQDPASAAAIAAADQVVLLTDAQPATASLVAQSADLLRQSGRPITVVVNRMPAHGGRLDLDRLSRYLPAARGLVVIPDEVPAAGRLAGGGFDWRDAPDGWQLALRQLAVVLVSDWPRLGLAT